MEKVKLFEPNLRVDRAHPTRTLDPPMCIVHFFKKKLQLALFIVRTLLKLPLIIFLTVPSANQLMVCPAS